jgi:nucleoside-diphosphate-sugar epimerase
MFNENSYAEAWNKDPYSWGKIHSEKIALEYANDYKGIMDVVCLIPTFIVGKRINDDYKGNHDFIKDYFSGFYKFMPH